MAVTVGRIPYVSCEPFYFAMELRGIASCDVVPSNMATAVAEGQGHAFLALPGGWGTLEEFFEVLTWGQLGLHRKPCGLLNVRGCFDGLLTFLDHVVHEGFVRPEHRQMVLVSGSLGALLDLFDEYVPPAVEKWIDRAST